MSAIGFQYHSRRFFRGKDSNHVALTDSETHLPARAQVESQVETSGEKSPISWTVKFVKLGIWKDNDEELETLLKKNQKGE
jgi:hypothetical protein